MEICPVTDNECPHFDAVKRLKLPGVQVAAFHESHEAIIKEAQQTYCAEGICGLDLLGTAAAVNIIAVSEAHGELTDKGK